MKSLIFIHGPNGVGKSTVYARLLQRLPQLSWLDSEWCRMINPFEFTPEIEQLVEKQMSALLRGYLECSNALLRKLCINFFNVQKLSSVKLRTIITGDHRISG